MANNLGLLEVWGQEALKRRIQTSVVNGRFPQSIVLTGPRGSGKRALGLWSAAALSCEETSPPCRECRSCRMVAKLGHPDVHLWFPQPRPKGGGTREKLREAIEEDRWEMLAQLRKDPYAETSQGATGLYLAAVDSIRGQAANRPAMGKRVVFVVDEAEKMVPQAATTEAANAFLKLLEEPSSYAFIILCTSRPEALLPTIRSRAASLRLPPVQAHELERHLRDRLGVSTEVAQDAAKRSGGVMRVAWDKCRHPSSRDENNATRILHAALSGSAEARYRTAATFRNRQARELLEDLNEVQALLRDMLCDACDASHEAFGVDRLRRLTGDRSPSEVAVLGALEAIEEAVGGTQLNLNPSATVAVLMSDMDAHFGNS